MVRGKETRMFSAPSLTSRTVARRSLLAAAGGAVAAALASCDTGGRSAVDFYTTKQEAIPYFREVTKAYNEEQDTYRVQHDTSTVLQASFVRNSPPDLGLVNYQQDMARFQERGALSDLADLPETATIREDVQELVTWQPVYPGRTSVLPYSIAGTAVIYNRRIFADNDIDVPGTWEEFLDVCERIKSAGVTPLYGTFRDSWTLSMPWDFITGGMVDVREFAKKMNAQGTDIGPDSEVSFQKDMREPMERYLKVFSYMNDDAPSRGYADGNTAMANGKAAMYFQGPWAFSEIAKAGTDIDLGTMVLPMTDDPDDRQIRVNIDLAAWVPEEAANPEGARAMLSHLMQPALQDDYNSKLLGFGTTEDSVLTDDPRMTEMVDYYEQGRFFLGLNDMIPKVVPWENYLQAVVNGADGMAYLKRVDEEWARQAYRK